MLTLTHERLLAPAAWRTWRARARPWAVPERSRAVMDTSQTRGEVLGPARPSPKLISEERAQRLEANNRMPRVRAMHELLSHPSPMRKQHARVCPVSRVATTSPPVFRSTVTNTTGAGIVPICASLARRTRMLEGQCADVAEVGSLGLRAERCAGRWSVLCVRQRHIPVDRPWGDLGPSRYDVDTSQFCVLD